METIASAALAVTMLAAVLLFVFGIRALRTDRQRGLLMIGCAIVFVANVLVWTI